MQTTPQSERLGLAMDAGIEGAANAGRTIALLLKERATPEEMRLFFSDPTTYMALRAEFEGSDHPVSIERELELLKTRERLKSKLGAMSTEELDLVSQLIEMIEARRINNG